MTRNQAWLTLALVCSMGCGDDDGPVEVDAGTDAGGAVDGGDAGSDPDDGGSDGGGPTDGGVDSGVDAAVARCQRTRIDDVQGDALSGDARYFVEDALPVGAYRVTYLGGCMRYSPGQGWTVNAHDGEPASFFLVREDTRWQRLPGTVGFAIGEGAFATEAECIGASRMQPSLQFELVAPQRLGVQLLDSGYLDNAATVAPSWMLESLSDASCPGPENVRFPSVGDEGVTGGAAVLGTDGGHLEGERTIAHASVVGAEGIVFFESNTLTCAPRFRVLINGTVVSQTNVPGDTTQFRWRSSIVGGVFDGPTYTIRYELDAESPCGSLPVDMVSSTVRLFADVELAD